MSGEPAPPDPRSADVDLVFWPVGLAFAGVPFADQVLAAAAGRFDGLAVAPMTIKRAQAQGLTLKDMAAFAEDHELRLTHADGVSTWVEEWFTAQDNALSREIRAAFDVPIQEALDIAEALGMTRIIAIALFDGGSLSFNDLVDRFGRLCDTAAAHRLCVDLEFIPTLGVPDLSSAWRIVKAVDRSNAGICVDTWHLQKGSSDYEGEMALLDTLPGHCLKTVQLVDGEMGGDGNALSRDVVTRKFPGEGTLEITRILATIDGKGALESVGPEVVGGRLAGLSMTETGEVAGATTRAALRLAREARNRPHS